MKTNKLNILLLGLMALSSSMVLAPKKKGPVPSSGEVAPQPRSGRRGGCFGCFGCFGCCSKGAAASAIAMTAVAAELMLNPEMKLDEVLGRLLGNFADALTKSAPHRGLEGTIGSRETLDQFSEQIRQIECYAQIDTESLAPLSPEDKSRLLADAEPKIKELLKNYALKLKENKTGNVSWLIEIFNAIKKDSYNNKIDRWIINELLDQLDPISDTASLGSARSKYSLVEASQRDLRGGGAGVGVGRHEIADDRSDRSAGTPADLDVALEDPEQTA